MALTEEETLACKMATELTKVELQNLAQASEAPGRRPGCAITFFEAAYRRILALLREEDR